MRYLLLLSLLLLTACESKQPLTMHDWVVVNYWAIWCAPCRDEIPELNHFSRAHKDRVSVIGINADGVTGSELQKQISELDIRFANPEQAPAVFADLKTPAQLPTTYVFYQGELRATLLGPQTLTTLQAAVAHTTKPANPTSPTSPTSP